jgi:hypothetical protein
MLGPRLYLSRNLLREDGVIFVAIDDNAVHNLRLLLNGIVGEENFIAQIILETATGNNPGQVAREHEYPLIHAKNKELQGDWATKSKKAQRIEKQYQKLRKQHGNAPAAIRTHLRAWLKENRADLRGSGHYDNADDRGVFHEADVANPRFSGYHYAVPHHRRHRPRPPAAGRRRPPNQLAQLFPTLASGRGALATPTSGRGGTQPFAVLEPLGVAYQVVATLPQVG